MDDLYGILSPLQPDYVAALRSQRRQLFGLIAEITNATRQLSLLDPSEFWSSSAQRAYRARIEEIVHGLHTVVSYLTEADEQMLQSIYQLQALDDR